MNETDTMHPANGLAEFAPYAPEHMFAYI